jgi:TonB-linked SusC/RagA family outer membrane protein
MNFTAFIKACRQTIGLLFPKTLLVMKLTCALMIIALVQVSAKGFTQKINLKEKNAPLEKVLSEINNQTGYTFLFTDQELKNTKITVTVKNASISEALDACFKNAGINYKIIDNNILLKPSDSVVSTGPLPVPPATAKGTILDENGKPLPGATIKVKGANRSTISNGDGYFSLDNIPDDAVLVITFVGYATREVSIKQNLDGIQLKPAHGELNEIVVVGYGTEKKINVTGAVASVSGTTLRERPVTNIQNLLQGRIPGLTVVQPTGEPGNDVGSLQIRGLGSYGASSSPLVLVDGVESSLSNLSPQNIESVTVLKDAASSAIYGSRSANGVILVTTKNGKRGTNIIEYSNYFGTTKATKLPSLITNSATYMNMYNQALERNGLPDLYTQAQIDAYKSGNGNAQYPNFNWMKYYFHSAPIQNHNLALSGGDSVSTYRISLDYQKQKGILAGYDYNRYNGGFNYSRKVNKMVTVGTNTNFSYENALSPIFTNDNAVLLIYAQAPTFAPTLPDGSGRVAIADYSTNQTPNRTLYERQNNGFQLAKNYNVNAQAYVNVNIIKGLDWKTTGALVFYNQDYKNRTYTAPFPVYFFQPDATGQYVQANHTVGNNLYQFSERDLTLTANSTISYQKDFGSAHHLGALAGYEQINNSSTNINGNRYAYTNIIINELNGGPSDGQNVNGDQSQYALQSFFGRATYNYKGKYFAEADIRRDGTSRVAYKWGTFGGGSAGWRISEEDFIKKNISWVDNLKLRVSYGQLGNQAIGNYPYQTVLSGTNYPFNNNGSTSLLPGVSRGGLTDPNIHWEKTAITDVGLDVNIFNGLFGGAIDWYYKNTTGILASLPGVPASIGLGAPTVNAGAMTNKGVEIQLTHQNHISDFTYGVNVALTLNRNKVTQVLSPNPGVFQTGLPFNSYYLYVWDGIFNSQTEIDASPKQPNSGTLKPGDLKIKDVNGDGLIDTKDQVSFNPFPSYTYSFGVNAGWKGFSITTFFQGVQGQKTYVNGWGFDPFIQGAAPTTEFLNAWTPQNHSQTVPAVYQNGYPGVSGYNSTYYLRDASYLRLKNINLSYTFPKTVLRSIWLKGLTIFVSGDNLITWTKYPGADPERAGSGRYAQYPQIKTYTAGLKVSL